MSFIIKIQSMSASVPSSDPSTQPDTLTASDIVASDSSIQSDKTILTDPGDKVISIITDSKDKAASDFSAVLTTTDPSVYIRSQFDLSKPFVAFTFDDGPYSPVTDRILDTLEKYNSQCTFFTVGNRVWSYPDSLKRADSLGCEIGNHTYSHAKLTSLSDADIFYQLNEADYQVYYYTGVTPDVIRPPEGSHDARTDAIIGKPIIMWSLDTRDWQSRDASAIINNVLNNIQDGDIVLMHDLYSSTADAVEQLVPALIDKGFQIVTVRDLAWVKGYELQPGQTYYYFK